MDQKKECARVLATDPARSCHGSAGICDGPCDRLCQGSGDGLDVELCEGYCDGSLHNFYDRLEENFAMALATDSVKVHVRSGM